MSSPKFSAGGAKFSTRPLYLQVRDLLVQQVLKGDWPPGSMLPNEIQLAKDLKVSLGTMRKALKQMEVEQIILRRQGRGTFVRDQTSDDLAIRFFKIIDGQDERIEGRVDVRNIE